MKLGRVFIAVGIVVAIATGVALFFMGAERYFPVARISITDGSNLIFADAPWTSSERCFEAVEKMVGVMRSNCAECKVESICIQIPEKRIMDALEGREIDLHVVRAGTLRILIDAGEKSRATCEALSGQIEKTKQIPTACVSPQASSQ